MPRFNVDMKESNFHEGKLALVKIGDNNLLLGMANGKLYVWILYVRMKAGHQIC